MTDRTAAAPEGVPSPDPMPPYSTPPYPNPLPEADDLPSTAPPIGDEPVAPPPLGLPGEPGVPERVRG